MQFLVNLIYKIKIMETPITIEAISQLLDSKLEPIKNDISAIRTDVKAMKTHIDSINERLYKIEDRMAKIEMGVDKISKRTSDLEAAAH